MCRINITFFPLEGDHVYNKRDPSQLATRQSISLKVYARKRMHEKEKERGRMWVRK